MYTHTIAGRGNCPTTAGAGWTAASTVTPTAAAAVLSAPPSPAVCCREGEREGERWRGAEGEREREVKREGEGDSERERKREGRKRREGEKERRREGEKERVGGEGTAHVQDHNTARQASILYLLHLFQEDIKCLY